MDSFVTDPEQNATAGPEGMVFIPGGTFRMGSDRHYPEEAPVHRVTVDGFWMDRTPVTNRQFRDFVRATGHVTFAEVAPNPKDYPGTPPHMLFAGSLVFKPGPSGRPGTVGRVVVASQRRELAPSLWPEEQHPRPRQPPGGARRFCRRACLCALGRQGPADRGRVGVRRARRARRRRIRVGRRVHAGRQAPGQYMAGRISAAEPRRPTATSGHRL